MVDHVVKPEPDETNRPAIEQMLLHAYEFALAGVSTETCAQDSAAPGYIEIGQRSGNVADGFGIGALVTPAR